MIIYSNSAKNFKDSVEENKITYEIEKAFVDKIGKRPSNSERNSWNNSSRFMETLVRKSNVPDDCGVLIEYTIPSTSKRIDYIITGHDFDDKKNFIIVELKQWDFAKDTNKNGIVKTVYGGSLVEAAHPSYQATSYKQFLCDLNEGIHASDIYAFSCAYLHNYSERTPEPLKSRIYKNDIQESPLFFKDDVKKLEEFLRKYVGKGKGKDISYRIEHGRIKPSKKLIDHVGKMIKGNREFILLDEQKVAYENIVKQASKCDKRRTIIVKGGPGTGKSVISINALAQIIKKEINIRFVAPNAAFRSVVIEMLTRDNSRGKSRIKNLFSGSSQFYDANDCDFDAIIVDEAHRLKKAGAYQYRGENQVEDIIKASKVNVFFIDDSQKIRPDDIGTVSEITKYAKKYYSSITEIELVSQFRCSGAEGYINWLDSVLDIRETGNFEGWDKKAFEFKNCESPNEVYQLIREKADNGYNARMLAGYAWNWSKKEINYNGEIKDVAIPEYDFAMPWNGRAISTLWAVNPDGINQIGCVHTSQGLEFDYVGIIIGNDLKFDLEKYELYADYSEYKDIVGKKGLKNNPEGLTAYVKNIYKILMSRGMKGCYVFCRDEALRNYFNKRLKMGD